MNSTTHALTRRRFIAASSATAGSLVVGFHIPTGAQQAATPNAAEINAWVVIHPDDRVVLRMARTEMGQGTRTGLCQMIAEELPTVDLHGLHVALRVTCTMSRPAVRVAWPEAVLIAARTRL